MSDPRWLTRLALDTMHAELLSEHGGSPGVRDAGLLESALARARNRHAYEADADIPAVAAAYLFGLAKNHGYVDGNKRIAFVAAAVFLEINGLELVAPEPDAYDLVIGLLEGRFSEPDAAELYRAHSHPR